MNTQPHSKLNSVTIYTYYSQQSVAELLLSARGT